MSKKIIVKATFTSSDPFDAEVLPLLEKEENKAAWLRKAAFCYVKGLMAQGQVIPLHAEPISLLSVADKKLNEKLGKFTL